MKRSILLLSIGMTSLLSACSFQKDPNKEPVTKVIAVEKEVKVGMTKEELYEDIQANKKLRFPDKLKLAMKNDDEELFEKLLREVKSYEINELGEDGDTALLMLLKMDADKEYIFNLLRNGASPYTPSRGLRVNSFDLLKEKDSSWDDIRAQLPFVDDELHRSLAASLYHTSFIVERYFQIRFPFLKEMKGRPSALEQLVNFQFQHQRNNQENICPASMRPFLGLIEKIEGPIQAKDPFGMTLAFFVMEDVGGFDFFREKMGRDFSFEERKALLETLKDTSLTWARDAHVILNITTEESETVVAALMKNVDTRGKKLLKKEFEKDTVEQMLREKYSDVYEHLLRRLEISEIQLYYDNECGACETLKTADYEGQTRKLHDLLMKEGHYFPECFLK